MISQFFLWIFLGPAHAAQTVPELPLNETPKIIEATLFSLEAPKIPLFQFRRTQKESDGKVLVDRSYRNLGDTVGTPGEMAVHESVIYENNRLKSYDLEFYQTQEKARVWVEGDRLKFSFTDSKGKTKTDEEKIEDTVLIGEQIPLFISTHWNELLKGQKVEFRLAVEDRLETVGFKLKKSEDKIENGRRLITIEMNPSSFLINLLVKTLRFQFDGTDPKPIALNYTGRTKPKLKKSGSYQPLDVLTVFSYPKY